MNSLIEQLESRNDKDAKCRAILRRSLGFDPGTHVPSFPYVEPFLGDAPTAWRRVVYYLVAGLWALHWREGRIAGSLSLGKAMARYQSGSKSESVEARFVNVLDADEGQLPHRLRQLVSLLKDEPLDFDDLIKGLLYWKDPQKRTQVRWARDFYADRSESDLPGTLNDGVPA